jgi:SH3 domain-containing YSC84-like protein 1
LVFYRAYQETIVEKPTIALPSVEFYLQNEIMKASNMLYNFKNTLGEEKIPRELLDIAKGVVFLTILKAGFMFTGRYGTGIVVAKLPNGQWSAPSALMLTGLGWGLQIGAEVTDVMLILTTEKAVTTFQSKAQISVGAELGVSVGPIGRSIESDVTAGSKGAAHAFSYAQSKGLFFGASLEAAGIAARPDVNQAFYGEKVSISNLLCGDYPPPKGAEVLYRAINEVLFDDSREETSSSFRPPTRYVTPAGAEDMNQAAVNAPPAAPPRAGDYSGYGGYQGYTGTGSSYENEVEERQQPQQQQSQPPSIYRKQASGNEGVLDSTNFEL